MDCWTEEVYQKEENKDMETWLGKDGEIELKDK